LDIEILKTLANFFGDLVAVDEKEMRKREEDLRMKQARPK
jgi:hypothetical protein